MSQGFQSEFVWPYFLSDKMKIGTRPNVRRCIKDLQRLGLIELKEEENRAQRNRKYYGLSFKGLLFELKNGVINPSEARDLRLKSKIDLPTGLSALEEMYSEDYYTYLMSFIDLDLYEKGLIISDTALVSSSVLLLLASHGWQNILGLGNNWKEQVPLKLFLELFPKLKDTNVMVELLFGKV